MCKPPKINIEESKDMLTKRIANLENVLMGQRKELEFLEEGDDMYDRVIEQVSLEVKECTLLQTYEFLSNYPRSSFN